MVQFRGTSLSVDSNCEGQGQEKFHGKTWCKMGQEYTRVSNESRPFFDDRPDLSQAGQMSEMSKGGIRVSHVPISSTPSKSYCQCNSFYICLQNETCFTSKLESGWIFSGSGHSASKKHVLHKAYRKWQRP